jgi:CheY-like chemotaxis protein
LGDSDRIIQTLTNLLGNAIKFSPAGTTVTMSGTSRDADFVFCVADQGRGVPEEMRKTIFERFSQVDASDSRDKGGSGLGLAISQSIVRAHGGRIWTEPNHPSGSRFQFTIPLAVTSSAATPAAIDRPASRTFLVLQDDGPPAIAQILERFGFDVVTSSSTAGAAALAASMQPHVVIIDVSDGQTARGTVEALASSADTRDIPIVVAAEEFPETSENYAAAVACWVRKPLKSEDLIHALDVAGSAPSVLVVEDDLDLARVMTTSLQSHGIRTFNATSGKEALRLCRLHAPSLIVLDPGLPDMNGFELVGVLRKSATLSRIPLLVYSAQEVGSADQSRLRLGPTDFLTKSRCSPAEFERHVVRLIATVASVKRDDQHAA